MEKPKSKVGKIVIFIVAMLVAILIGVVITQTDEKELQRYSVTNNLAKGYGVIFETLKQCDLEVERICSKPNKLPSESCQLIVQLEDEEELEEWVENGGIVVEITYDKEYVPPVDIKLQGSGKWITVYGKDGLTNEALREDTQVAYELYSTLVEEANGRTIYFNEYYLAGQQAENFKLWHVMPDFIKAMLIQLSIALAFYLAYKGKRFGKVMGLPEEEERTENEYVYAAAALYKKAGAWDLVVHNYYEVLVAHLRKLTRQEADFLTMWEKEALPDLKIAKEVNDSILQLAHLKQGEKCQLNKKQVQPIIEKITYLIKQVDQRREEYWKQ